jgi:hypothetical protein
MSIDDHVITGEAADLPWAEASIAVSFQKEYSSVAPTLRALYEKGRRAQWNPATSIDWDLEVEFGSSLPDTPGSDDFPFGGADVWNRYRWELQSWMVSQFLHG